MYDPRRKKVVTESLESRCLLSASSIVAVPYLQVLPDDSSSSIQGFTPQQISTAYDFGGITLSGGVKGTGAGETIAIVDAYNDPNIASDLATFDSQFDLAAPPKLTVVSQSGSTTELPTSDAGWDQEIALDVEWAHAMAPQANILLVETNSDNLNSLLTGVTYAASAPNVAVVSMSWGSSEFSGENTYDSDFTSPGTHKGVTFVSAAGDDGSFNGPNWPADSPNVLSVGGTSLTTTDSAGDYGGEVGWDNTTGGISSFEGEPSYQDEVQTTGDRTAPDVAYDADPNTGVAVYDSVSYEGVSGWQVLGGTSVGAPQWAALIAIADQDRAISHAGSLNGGSGTLPKLYALADSATSYASAFNDITVGGFGSASAGPGYDLLTGLGTPIAPAVVTGLQDGGGGVRTGATLDPVTITYKRPRIHFHTPFFDESESDPTPDAPVTTPVTTVTTSINPPTETKPLPTYTITPAAVEVTSTTTTANQPTSPAKIENAVASTVSAQSNPAAGYENSATAVTQISINNLIATSDGVSVAPVTVTIQPGEALASRSVTASFTMTKATVQTMPFHDGSAIRGALSDVVADPITGISWAAIKGAASSAGWNAAGNMFLNLPMAPAAIPLAFTRLPALALPTLHVPVSVVAWSELGIAAVAGGMWIAVYRQGRRRRHQEAERQISSPTSII